MDLTQELGEVGQLVRDKTPLHVTLAIEATT
jgi:hypothetical protein